MQLTAEVLTDRFRKLKSLKLKRRCERVARQLSAEDGVRGALNSFYKQYHINQGWLGTAAELAREKKLKEAEVITTMLYRST
jgi:NAD-dependent oxidoreductase involved in siderophore biosynthesis